MIFFFKYSIIGLLNTLLHMSVFLVLNYFFSVNQAVSNVVAFLIAVTFSYIVNSKYNFKSKYDIKKYMYFVVIMGVISFGIGFISDQNQINPFITMIIFTLISLILGFFLSKYYIFKR